jgi:hypothetical protein
MAFDAASQRASVNNFRESKKSYMMISMGAVIVSASNMKELSLEVKDALPRRISGSEVSLCPSLVGDERSDTSDRDCLSEDDARCGSECP